MINSYVHQKQSYHSNSQNTHESLILQKIETLEFIRSNFLRLISSYFDNAFTCSFTSFFDVQL